MLKFNPVTKKKGECITIGRGAVGIYLSLLEIGRIKGKVLVPANICYAAVFPILCANYEPVFCDVNQFTGNLTLQSIKNRIDDKTVAVIAPHMYGNPIKDLLKINEYLKERGIFLIEDCASLMTNDGAEYVPGTVGDYVVYSTGYSKTIDIGFGGLLFSDKYSLKGAERKEKLLPLYNDIYNRNCLLFSKIYRVIRNEHYKSDMIKDFYMSLQYSFKNSFIFTINLDMKNKIIKSIEDLPSIIEERRRKYNLYKNYFDNKNYFIYPYENKAVPWRFNMFISKDRESFINYCLENKLPISDWYPCVAEMFEDYSVYKNTVWHECNIVNFPLMIPDEEIIEICNTIIKYFGDK